MAIQTEEKAYMSNTVVISAGDGYGSLFQDEGKNRLLSAVILLSLFYKF